MIADRMPFGQGQGIGARVREESGVWGKGARKFEIVDFFLANENSSDSLLENSKGDCMHRFLALACFVVGLLL